MPRGAPVLLYVVPELYGLSSNNDTTPMTTNIVMEYVKSFESKQNTQKRRFQQRLILRFYCYYRPEMLSCSTLCAIPLFFWRRLLILGNLVPVIQLTLTIVVDALVILRKCDPRF